MRAGSWPRLCRAAHLRDSRPGCLSSPHDLCAVCLHGLAAYLSIRLSVYLAAYLSIRLSVYLAADLSIRLSVYLAAYLSIRLSVYLAAYLSLRLSVYLAVYLSIRGMSRDSYLSMFLSVSIAIYLSIHLSIHRQIIGRLSLDTPSISRYAASPPFVRPSLHATSPPCPMPRLS